MKFAFLAFLSLFFFTTGSQAIQTEGVCADQPYPLDDCDAVHICPRLCGLHSQVWTGNFGTSTALCEDQQKEGNTICVCLTL